MVEDEYDPEELNKVYEDEKITDGMEELDKLYSKRGSSRAIDHCALDIGGSMAKLVYFERLDEIMEPSPKKEQGEIPKSPIILKDGRCKANSQSSENEVDCKGGRLSFATWRTKDILPCLGFLEKYLKKNPRCKSIHATGGGSVKFRSLIEQRLGIEVKKFDEMKALINGLNILLKNLHDETFIFKGTDPKTGETNKEYVSYVDKSPYPYLLVNIGSGVSIIKVTSDTDYERISGSSIGGGTFWGLCRMLTNCGSFEEMLNASMKGDHKNVDMLVGDIYGRGYLNLSADTIASSFAKPIMKHGTEIKNPGSGFKDEDICQSFLLMICFNIAQISYLNAMAHNLKRVYFAGHFIKDHAITMHSISETMKYWSKGTIKAFFLTHEGYLGSIGSMFGTYEEMQEESAQDNPEENQSKTEDSDTPDKS